MNKSYLFVYNNTVGTQEEVKNILNRMSLIWTWRYDMPNVFYIVSSASANEIAKQFESINGTKGRFIVLEFTGNSQGRLTGASWFLLENKYHEKEDNG